MDLDNLITSLASNPWVRSIGKKGAVQSELVDLTKAIRGSLKENLPGENDNEGEDDYKQATDILNKQLTLFPKHHAWWLPPTNYVINMALMGINTWEFSVLPLFAEKTAYRQKTDRLPEGIVLDPTWRPTGKNDPTHGETLPPNAKVAEALVKLVKGLNVSVTETAEHQLTAIEKHFNVQIPSGVKTKILADVLPMAKRRWGTDRLRRKKLLFPFDGSKKIELGSWD
jgi:hypothetical protein